MSGRDVRTLLDGLCFGECPRWRDGRLWFSDQHDGVVQTVTPDGTHEIVVEVPGGPSGIAWMPDGDLLVVSMNNKVVMRWDGSTLREHADLTPFAKHECNDMVVDAAGRAYVGHFGFDLNGQATPEPASIVVIDPHGSARVAADELMFPNGMVIAPDGGTLIVGETFGLRLTAFTVAADGSLTDRRVFAALPSPVVPDGICLDAEGAVWVASPTTREVLRVADGGEVLERISTGEHGSFACMLGGDDRRTLFICTAASFLPEETKRLRSGAIRTVRVDVPGAGLP